MKAKTLREIRDKRDLSQSKFADLINGYYRTPNKVGPNMTRENISAMERGKCAVSWYVEKYIEETE